jgi:sec-independent protein translocase protein TatA
MFDLSLSHILIILLLVLVLFGAGKLPSVLADLGKGVKAFREGMTDAAGPQKPAARKRRKSS